ncbi:MAG TPA: PQQ-binding-like beta-propeller repeat protein [Gemmatales bacterium]|nr:PQQ-binding-like beta-propeller repeat protein [Gemmatales bacterium]HMP58223.1 PQQ-binding-like beta-propeller repeat protein [Gemmatales bacterium]
MSRCILTSLMLLLVGAAGAAHDHWPEFRGGSWANVRDGAGIPSTWARDRNVGWSVAIPGSGWSSPVIWERNLFLTTVVTDAPQDEAKKGLYFGGERNAAPEETHHWTVLCLDAERGTTRWQTKVHEGRPAHGKHIKNTYASETPVTDGERLYVWLGEVGVFCLDFDGKVIWGHKWPSHPTRNSWGYGASPVLHKDRLYIVNDNEKDSYIVALDKATGSEVWRQSRPEKSNWSTPFVWENEIRTEIVTAGTGGVRSYDLDGKLLWELKGMSAVTVPSSFARDGLLYVSSGFVMDKSRPLYAIRPGASGDISLEKGQTQNDFIVWCQPQGAAYHPTPLIYQGLCYVLYDQGFIACFDAKTGAEVYGRQRVNPRGSAQFTASPWAYDGKIFCLSEDGDTFVLQAGREFKVLGVNPLEEMALATPGLAKGRAYLRTKTRLYCIQQTE